jgi:hypothetical protein
MTDVLLAVIVSGVILLAFAVNVAVAIAWLRGRWR